MTWFGLFCAVSHPCTPSPPLPAPPHPPAGLPGHHQRRRDAPARRFRRRRAVHGYPRMHVPRLGRRSHPCAKPPPPHTEPRLSHPPSPAHATQHSTDIRVAVLPAAVDRANMTIRGSTVADNQAMTAGGILARAPTHPRAYPPTCLTTRPPSHPPGISAPRTVSARPKLARQRSDGNATPAPAPHGTQVWNSAAEASGTLFRNNSARDFGGAVLVEGATSATRRRIS